MQKIVPHLWYDKEAREAAEFYTSLFPDSRVEYVTTLQGTPSGAVDVVSFVLSGQEFMCISAGPYFQFTPAISFMVACATPAEVDALWEQLADGGKVLMELGAYPFSTRYGWVQDRYGLSWQLICMDGRKSIQRITPSLLFVGERCGKAEEAMRFYASVFRDAKVGDMSRYGANAAPDKEGTVMYGEFALVGQQFIAMDSAHKHAFTFNEAFSFLIRCDTQAEIDYFWERLSAVPEAEQCGWLKDTYGVSWQIVPTAMDAMMRDEDPERRARVTKAFLAMKKFDVEQLQRAYEG
ncbi:MAG: VOC family protein [bacterium]|nr:VOC family protein [bacterium]